MGASLKYS